MKEKNVSLWVVIVVGSLIQVACGDSGSDEDIYTDDPIPYEILHGPRVTEDLTFDDQGYVFGAQDTHLFRTRYDGEPELIVPNAGIPGDPMIGGIQALPGGGILYCDPQTGTLFKADASGTKQAVVTGLELPNALEVDRDGFIYLTEVMGGRIRRIDPETWESTVLVSGIQGPEGISFSPDYKILYTSGAISRTVYAIDIDENGNAGEPREFASDFLDEEQGIRHLNGLKVDRNGYVYVVELLQGELWRISPDGQEKVLLTKVDDWLAGLEWGSGHGGWDPKTLYLCNRHDDDIIYTVNIGIPGKPRYYP